MTAMCVLLVWVRRVMLRHQQTFAHDPVTPGIGSHSHVLQSSSELFYSGGNKSHSMLAAALAVVCSQRTLEH